MRLTMLRSLPLLLALHGLTHAQSFEPFNFVVSQPEGFGLQNVDNDFSVESTVLEGDTLVIRGNTWLAIPLRRAASFTLLPNTVLEFDMEMLGVAPEFIAVGLERDFLDSEAEQIRVAGTQNYGVQYLPPVKVGSPRRVRLELGRLMLNRVYPYLTFSRDHDSNPSGSVRISNVRLFSDPFYQAERLSFTAAPPAAFTPLNSSSRFRVGAHEGPGEALSLSGDSSVVVDLGEQVFSGVRWLEFDAFQTASASGLTGVAFFQDLSLEPARVLKIGGADAIGEELQPTLGTGQATTYRVGLGERFEGQDYRYLAFLRDEDVATTGTVTFSNVRLFENNAAYVMGWQLE